MSSEKVDAIGRHRRSERKERWDFRKRSNRHSANVTCVKLQAGREARRRLACLMSA